MLIFEPIPQAQCNGLSLHVHKTIYSSLQELYGKAQTTEIKGESNGQY